MKKEHISIFLVIIAIILGIIFIFSNNKSKNTNTLQYTAGCQSDKIDASVYRLRGDTSLIGAFISFQEVPISQEVQSKLDELGVIVVEGSWIFDYALTKIPTESLCTLAENDFVKGIFIPEIPEEN